MHSALLLCTLYTIPIPPFFPFCSYEVPSTPFSTTTDDLSCFSTSHHLLLYHFNILVKFFRYLQKISDCRKNYRNVTLLRLSLPLVLCLLACFMLLFFAFKSKLIARYCYFILSFRCQKKLFLFLGNMSHWSRNNKII